MLLGGFFAVVRRSQLVVLGCILVMHCRIFVMAMMNVLLNQNDPLRLTV